MLMSEAKPLALSLFSGAGGMDIGVSQAGFDILACIEIDPYCCDTLREAIQREQRSTRVIEKDIRQVDPVQLMTLLELAPGDLDLICAGPPCQAFSQIGKRNSLSDERGMLLFEVIRFAAVFRPKAIIIEQVKGLLNAPDEHDTYGGVFQLLIEQLQALGYIPKWKVVSSADYGVAQLRQRVFIVSMLDTNSFEFPTPTHGDTDQSLPLFPLLPYTVVGDVLQGLPEPASKTDHPADTSHIDVTPEGDRYRIHGVPEGSHLASQHHLPTEQRRNLTKKDTTKFRRLSRTQPSLTLRCGEIFFHPLEDRYLTPREYMRIHGYPDHYVLKGPVRGRCGRVRKMDQHRQVANSVPPPIAHILAKSIVHALNGGLYVQDVPQDFRDIRLSNRR